MNRMDEKERARRRTAQHSAHLAAWRRCMEEREAYAKKLATLCGWCGASISECLCTPWWQRLWTRLSISDWKYGGE